jgi:tRNA nucleotidyltransferase (CCA-adding enzyme)
VAARRDISTAALGDRIAALPGFAEVRAAARSVGADAYLVGGAVRDVLLGEPATNLDLVVVGDHLPLVGALSPKATVHDRFETATVMLAGEAVDVARARAERYPHPGALPEVWPAGLGEDLGRRDFSINAMAVALTDPDRLIDPLAGLADLRLGALRVLHAGSFVDDPTRAVRAARYAGRLGLEPEAETLELLRATDFETVSRERVAAELGKLATEPEPRPGFELLGSWGLIELAPGSGEVVERVTELLAAPPWRDEAARPTAILAAVRGPGAGARELAELEPSSPSAAVAAARGRDPVELVLARALGAAWLDDYVERWRDVALEISGEDLIEAGIAEGPAVGRGLAAALRAKLDGETGGRDDELRIALEAARA